MCSVGEDCQESLLDMKHFHSSSDFGLYKVEEKSNGIVCWFKCALLLIGLSSVILVILHFTINAGEQSEPPHNSTDDVKQSEKLVSPPLATEIPPTPPPEPFYLKPSGLHPHRFTPTFPTTQRTTLRYPQLTNYRHRYYPQNVRQVVRFMTEGPSRHRLDTSRLLDPLQPYKPNDPSEVNLLATGDVRFAPPAWRDFQGLNQVRQNVVQQPLEHQENVSLVGTMAPRFRTNRFRPQVIPLASEDGTRAASTIINSAEGFPEPHVRNQQGARGSLAEMFRKPFVVTMSVYPGSGQTVETKPPMPEESLQSYGAGGETPVHVSLKVFPSVSYSAVYHK